MWYSVGNHGGKVITVSGSGVTVMLIVSIPVYCEI